LKDYEPHLPWIFGWRIICGHEVRIIISAAQARQLWMRRRDAAWRLKGGPAKSSTAIAATRSEITGGILGVMIKVFPTFLQGFAPLRERPYIKGNTALV
jgi:hypothetical protein